jgi:NAD(P)-dependent dehydrogenase (short-subunit alcohol dehydrogenase family)
MARIFITGSTDGLGRATARTLMEEGHQVVLHARSRERSAAVADLALRSAGLVVGDLSSAGEIRQMADEVNTIGRMDAVIHNAGTYAPSRGMTPEGHATTLAVNTLAPYMLTALIERPSRLIYLSSSMHREVSASMGDVDWVQRRWDASRAYSESKLYVTALAFAVARRWPDVLKRWAGEQRRMILRWDTSLRPGSRSAMILPREAVAGIGITASGRLPLQKHLIQASRTGWWPS